MYHCTDVSILTGLDSVAPIKYVPNPAFLFLINILVLIAQLGDLNLRVL